MGEIVRFALRVPQEVYEAVQALAAQHRRSINGEMTPRHNIGDTGVQPAWQEHPGARAREQP